MTGWPCLAGRLPSRAREGAKPRLEAPWADADARCPVRWPRGEVRRSPGVLAVLAGASLSGLQPGLVRE